jgi:TolB-like protein
MTNASKAVFLSYASQDAPAAARIAGALRAAGIEVWLDQSELRGGDAWDHHIRRQIQDCALFVPIISHLTQSRPEGYFRLEWDLADQRSHMIARSKAFVLPVCIDDTPEHGAEVPESFLRAQWTRLPGGETPAAFCERVKALLGRADSGGAGVAAPAAPMRRAAAFDPEATVVLGKKKISGAWIGLGIAALLLVAAAVLRPWKWVGGSSGARPAPEAPATAATAPAAPAKSIAVLPFVDMSQKRDQEYFSDGLSEELIDRLSHNPDLIVTARTSSFAFKGKNEDIRTIARTLGVAHLLEGSVRKAGNQLRITAQLIRAADGAHLWSESYERQLTDVFKVQEDIAAAVVKGLQAKLLPAAASVHSVAHNMDAYSLYLRGQYFARRASDADVEQGIAILKQAIALEPDFAPAHAELANAYGFKGTFGNGGTADLYRSRDEADIALRLDPTLRSAQNQRANVALTFWDWAGARKQLDEMLAASPTDPDGLMRRGLLARAFGHLDEALAYIDKGLQVDPLRVINHVQLAMLLDAMRRPAEAKAAAEAALAINPKATKAHLLIGFFELEAGHVDAASAAIEQESSEYYRLEGQSVVAFARKQLPESDAALKRLIDHYGEIAALQVAQAYAFRGDRAKAFEWLDRAVAQYDPGLINVKTDPLFTSLHGDPRFSAVLRKINLPE